MSISSSERNGKGAEGAREINGVWHKRVQLDDGGFGYLPVHDGISQGKTLEDAQVDPRHKLHTLELAERAAMKLADDIRNRKIEAQAEVEAQEQADAAALAAAEEARQMEAYEAFRNGKYVVPDLTVKPLLPGAGHPVGEVDSGELKRPAGRRRVVGGATLGVVLLASGGYGSYVTTDGWKSMPSFLASATAGEEKTVLDPAKLDIGDCITDKDPDTLFGGSVAFQGDVLWPLPLADGRTLKIRVADESADKKMRYPNVQISAPVEYLACVPDEQAGDFLKVNGGKVTADLSKITPQLVIGNNTAPDPVEPFNLAETKDSGGKVIVTKEAADAAVAASKDPANISYLLNTATAHAGVALTKPEGQYTKELADVLNLYKDALGAEIKSQAAELGYENVEAAFTGEIGLQFEYKGPEVVSSDKVSLDEKSLRITEFVAKK